MNDLQFTLKSIERSKKNDQKHRNIEREELSRISLNCIQDGDLKYVNDQVSKDLTKKILTVTFTSLLTYYGVYQLCYNLLKQQVSQITFNSIIFLFFATFSFLIIYFIWRKDFGKTQFMLYLAFYGGLSIIGVIFIITRFILITSYDIINSFLLILSIQILLFYITTPVTRKMVCRTNKEYSHISNIKF